MSSKDSRKWNVVGKVTFMTLQSIFTSAVVLFVLLMPKSVISWKILLTMDNLAVIIGIMASAYLLKVINKSEYTANLKTDPSFGLKAFFLWIFGIGLIAEVFLYLLIDMECLFFEDDIDIHFIDPAFLRISTILCFILQLVVITKGRNKSIAFTWKVKMSIYLIIFLNMDFWIKGTAEDISKLFMKEAFIESYNVTNRSRDLISRACFWESGFQQILTDLYPYTLPMQFEFQMLATVLLLQMQFRQSMLDENSCTYDGIRLAFCSTGQKKYAFGSLITGILSAVLFIAVRFLGKFCPYNEDIIVNFYLVFLATLNIFFIILIVSALRIWKRRCSVSTQYRCVSANEYAIVITGMCPIIYYAILISFSRGSGEFILIFLSSSSAIFLIHYQTIYVLCTNCYRTFTDASFQDRCMLTVILVSLSMGNMSYWVVNTFIEMRNTSDWIVEVDRDWYLIKRLTDPLCTYYRFHMSMEFYSQLKRLT